MVYNQLRITPILEDLAKYIENQINKNDRAVEISYAVLLMLSNSYRAYKTIGFLIKNGFPYDSETKKIYFYKDELEKLKKLIDELKRKESLAGII